MNVMEQGNRFGLYFNKRKNYSTKNVELAMWDGQCGENVEKNYVGKLWKTITWGKVWKNCEKNSVGKMWKTITWENCGK